MTQQETIDAIRAALCPVFWKYAIRIESDGVECLERITDSFIVHPNGQIFVPAGSYGYLPISKDEAVSRLRLDETAWQRANPEKVREKAVEIKELQHGLIRLRLNWAGGRIDSAYDPECHTMALIDAEEAHIEILQAKVIQYCKEWKP